MRIFHDVLIRPVSEGESRRTLIVDSRTVSTETHGATLPLFEMEEVIDFYVHATLLFRPTVLRLSLRDQFRPYELQIEFCSPFDLETAVKLLRAAGLTESISR